MKTNNLSTLLVTALCLFGMMTPSYAAGKGNGGGKGGGGGGPGGGGTPAGTIYYLGPTPGIPAGSGSVTFSMNPDGSSQAPVAGGGWMAAFGKPSRDLHNNHRWFVGSRIISGEYYPDGSLRRELFAYRDDYDPNVPETKVQLTDDITLVASQPRWLPGDGAISFVGKRWDGATVVEGGIYTVDLSFDVDGNIIGLAGIPATPTFSMPLFQSSPDVGHYSWDPNGTMIAYNKASAYGIWLDDLSGPEVQVFHYIAGGPEWSPNGESILFSQSGSIWTIKANGKRAVRVVQDTAEWSFSEAHWSTDSQHLVFRGASRSENKTDVFRSKANGSELTQLTSNTAPDKSYMPHNFSAWR
ncbi:MAG: TolB family protein [Puniceicoccaceae bacterium]